MLYEILDTLEWFPFFFFAGFMGYIGWHLADWCFHQLHDLFIDWLDDRES